MKILVVTPTFLPYVGGAEIGIHEIYKRLGEEHEVHILTPYLEDKRNDETLGDYKTSSYKIIRFKNPLMVRGNLFQKVIKAMLSISAFYYIKALNCHLRTFKPDIINYHYAVPEGLALVYSTKILKIPSVLSLVGRTDVYTEETSFLKKVYLSLVINSATKITSITKYCVSGLKKNQVTIVPYGVDTNRFKKNLDGSILRDKLNLNKNTFVLFTVQRLIRLKGVDRIIDIFKQVLEHDKDIILIIGGSGPDKEFLIEKAKALGIREKIIFTGYISEEELPEYYALADLFLFYSMNETFGVVLVQAMSSGLPILSVSSTAIPEVIKNDQNGYLFSPDNIQSFADKIIELHYDKKTLQRISQFNRIEASEKYNWDVISKYFNSIIVS